MGRKARGVSQTPALADEAYQRVAKIYKFGESIGSGSYAVVFQGTVIDSNPARYVAIKQLDKTRLEEQLKRSIKREINTLSKLKELEHAHIVDFIMWDHTDWYCYIVTEFCDLGDMSHLLLNRSGTFDRSEFPSLDHMLGKYPSLHKWSPKPVTSANPNAGLYGLHPIVAQHFMQQLVAGMSYIWNHGIVHRDIKPQNILLTTSPLYELFTTLELHLSDVRGALTTTERKIAKEKALKSRSLLISQTAAMSESTLGIRGVCFLPIARIADFGFSKGSADLGMTLCGSPLYMAPEILEYKDYSATLTDLWSTGIVCFEMLVGTSPFGGADAKCLLRNILKAADRVPFREYDGKPEIQRLISAILKINPKSRIKFNDLFDHPIISEPIAGVDPEYQFKIKQLPRLVWTDPKPKKDTSSGPSPDGSRGRRTGRHQQPRTQGPSAGRQGYAGFYPKSRDGNLGARRHSGDSPAVSVDDWSPSRRPTNASPISSYATSTRTHARDGDDLGDYVVVPSSGGPSRPSLLTDRLADLAIRPAGTREPVSGAGVRLSEPARDWAAAPPARERNVGLERAGSITSRTDSARSRTGSARRRSVSMTMAGSVMATATPVPVPGPSAGLGLTAVSRRGSDRTESQMTPPTPSTGSTGPRDSGRQRGGSLRSQGVILRAVQMVSSRLPSILGAPPVASTAPARSGVPLAAATPSGARPVSGGLRASPTTGLVEGSPAGGVSLLGGRRDMPAAQMTPFAALIEGRLPPPGGVTEEDPDLRVVRMVEDLAVCSDVVYRFAEVKWQEIETDDKSGGLRLPAAEEVKVTEEVLVLYLKTISLLTKAIDGAAAWWSNRKPPDDGVGLGPPVAESTRVRMGQVLRWAQRRFRRCVSYADWIGQRLEQSQRRLPIGHPNRPAHLTDSEPASAALPSQTPVIPAGPETGSTEQARTTAEEQADGGVGIPPDSVTVPAQVVLTTGVTAERLLYRRAFEVSRSAAVLDLLEKREECLGEYRMAIALLEALLDSREDRTGTDGGVPESFQTIPGLDRVDRRSVIRLLEMTRNRSYGVWRNQCVWRGESV